MLTPVRRQDVSFSRLSLVYPPQRSGGSTREDNRRFDMKVLFCFDWLKQSQENTKLSPFKRLLPMMAAQALNSLSVSVLLYILGLSLSEDAVVELHRSILKEGFHRFDFLRLLNRFYAYY